MNWNAAAGGAPAAQTNISNFPFNEREIKNKRRMRVKRKYLE